MNVEVREARPDDLAAWLKLWQGYLDFAGSTLSDAVTHATWARIHSPESTLLCRVAVVDGQLAGFALCVMHEGTWVTNPICYLEDLYVDVQLRGRGTGRALIEALRQEGEKRGWAKLYWVTRTTNPARKLYDQVAELGDVVRYNISL